IYAGSMVMLASARRKVPVPWLAWWLLGVGIAATLAANVVHGLGHGPAGAVVAAWPAVALVGSYELLMVIIRSAQAPAGTAPGPGASGAPGDDPLRAQAAEEFAGEVAAGRVPSVRVIRAGCMSGSPARSGSAHTSWRSATRIGDATRRQSSRRRDQRK
ncbi:MAG: hypothetical protein ACRDOI_42905, partial [Trebonia sp.]